MDAYGLISLRRSEPSTLNQRLSTRLSSRHWSLPANTRRFGCLEQRGNANCASKIIGRAFAGRVGATPPNLPFPRLLYVNRGEPGKYACKSDQPLGTFFLVYRDDHLACSVNATLSLGYE